MNLLKTDKVFFIGLATTATVKGQKNPKKQGIMKKIMMRNNTKNKPNTK